VKIDDLPPHLQDNVVRVALAAETSAKSRNQEFDMDLDSVAELVAEFGGLNDPTFIMPAGLVGKWVE
jgi:hypothetical protein